MKKYGKGTSFLGIVILLCIATTFVFAQAPDTLWTKTYGGTGFDDGYSVQQTSDGGYIVAGNTESFGAGGCDIYLIKTEADGDTLWTRTYGGTGLDEGRSVQQTSDSGYIVAGGTWSFGAGDEDVYLIKTDADGDTLWTKTYGGTGSEWCASVRQTSDSGYIVAGGTRSFGAGEDDVYLIKTDADGDTLWTKVYGGAGSDFGYAVQEISEGGYIVAGRTMSFGPGISNVYLMKIDASGDTLWTKIYGKTSTAAIGFSVQQTSDSGYIVTGLITSGPGQSYGYLIRTYANGDTLWTKTYGEGGDYDWLMSVQPTSDSGYIVAGFTDSQGAGSADVWLIKTDSDGDTLWTKTYGGDAADYGYSVQQTSDGGYIVAGSTESAGSGNGDAWLIKTAPDTFGIEEYHNTKSKIFRLDVSPNPFSQKTLVRFQIPSEVDSRFQIIDGRLQIDNYSLKIYDVSGCLVKIFSLPTAYSLLPTAVSWDGSDNSGQKLASGVYFLEFTAGDYSITEKLLLIR